jgi:hypothetical protein
MAQKVGWPSANYSAILGVNLNNFVLLWARGWHSERGLDVKAWILIVGDDPILQHTRAELLRDWQIATASSRDAGKAMLARKYDLLIFSQTVQEAVAKSLIAQAQQLHPNPMILTIRSGSDRQLGSPTYEVDLNNPGGLRSAVARILDHPQRHPVAT